MTMAELAEIRALLIAQEALEAERSRGLMGRLQQMFAPPRKTTPEPPPVEAAPQPEVEPPDDPHRSLFELAEELPLPEPPRPHFGRRDDEPLDLVEPVPLPEPRAASPWGSLSPHPAEDEGAPYLPDDLVDDADWSDQALFEASIADWAALLPVANDGSAAPPTAQALLLRLEASLRIEREALERRLQLKAA